MTSEEQQRFTDITNEAAHSGSYNDPVALVRALPESDQHVLRRVHSLAFLSGVQEADTEGAYKLLLPPSEFVDINNDALVKVGAASTFVFPPPKSPQSVKDAWEERSQNMTERQKMAATATFTFKAYCTNLKEGQNGVLIGVYEYTDPEYRNIFHSSEAGWQTFLKDMVSEHENAVPKTTHLATLVHRAVTTQKQDV